MKPLALIFVALTMLVGPVLADQAPVPYRNALLDRLVGHWVLRGTIAGQTTTHDVAAEWVLGHQYVRVHEVSREKDGHGQPQYEALVFLGVDPADSTGVACLWLDNTGASGLDAGSIGHAPAGADALAFRFATPDGGVFHTTFAYRAASDTWAWRMDAETEGALQSFARVTLMRAGASQR
jgi:hypothetical protein